MPRLILVFFCMISAIIACGSVDVQPENTRIMEPLEAECGDYTVPASHFTFGEWATTDDSELLHLRIKVDMLRTIPASQSDVRIAVYSVEVENVGNTHHAFFPSLQTFVSKVGSETGIWPVSGAAMNEAGRSLEDAMLDGAIVHSGQSVHFEIAAYTPSGTVNSITFILDPLAEATPNQAVWTRINPDNCAEGQIP